MVKIRWGQGRSPGGGEGGEAPRHTDGQLQCLI